MRTMLWSHSKVITDDSAYCVVVIFKVVTVYSAYRVVVTFKSNNS
jgi:hypothetical protein